MYDTSGGNFKIRGQVLLTAPRGEELWKVGDKKSIQWDIIGSIGKVKLKYSTDGGRTYPYTIVDSVDAGEGSITWVIPDINSSEVRIRISDTSDATVYDVSDNFTIHRVISLLTPNGNERWDVGTRHDITWRISGAIPSVLLEYSIDEGQDAYPYIIASDVIASDGVYSWTIPDSISQRVKVKISDTSTPQVYDTSDDTFTIAGKLVVRAPNGGEVWPVNSSQFIAWAAIGTIENVRLEYSTDGGITYPHLIVSATPAQDGFYEWEVPDIISSTVRIKVSDLNDSRVYDTSDGNVKIRGKVRLLTPHGGEAWYCGEYYDIGWERFGPIRNIKLEYSIDGGKTFPYLIADSIDASLERYSWRIPETTSLRAQVKVSDCDDATVYDISRSTFILRGKCTVTSPNGGEAWDVDSTQTISWTTQGTIDNVTLEYSIDNGVNWYVISEGISNTGRYAWRVPETVSSQCLVRVSDSKDLGAYDTSDDVFKIHSVLTLTSPGGGEVWVVGLTEDITWQIVGVVSHVRLEYSTDGGKTFPYLIIDEALASRLTYPWKIPDTLSKRAMVKISDSNDSRVFDVSRGFFSIKGTFNITNPQGGEEWIVGTTQEITWDTQGTIPYITLEYSSDTDEGWRTIAQDIPNSGAYLWTIPDALSVQSRIRISSGEDPSTFNTSKNFTIRGNLIVTVPNGGEIWTVGSRQQIRWDTRGTVSKVSLEYSDDGGSTFSPIVTTISNNGSYSWSVPEAVTIQAVVKVSSIDDPRITDISDAYFTIRGTLTLRSPQGGEIWIVGSTHDISWNSQGEIPSVNLSYSTDGGESYASGIISDLANTGMYTWTIPDDVSGEVRVKVADASSPDVYSTSNTNFRIRCAFTLSAPNGGEYLKVGQTYPITWTIRGTIPDVTLQYSRDDFASEAHTISRLVPNTTIYYWIVPDAISDRLKIRISDPDDSDASDVSDNVFSIIPEVTVASPNGGEVWKVGSSQEITWETSGTVPQLRLEYSTDGGKTFTFISAVPNTGVYAWTIPDKSTHSLIVRVTDLADSKISDTSDLRAEIVPKLTLLTPNGGEVLSGGDSYEITWNCQGTLATVKLYYSLDDFITPIEIATSTPNDGSFMWEIPEIKSTNVKVRVKDGRPLFFDVYDDSDNPFTIRVDTKFNVSP